MNRNIIFCVLVFLAGIMSACKNGMDTNSFTDTTEIVNKSDCDGVIYPNYAPSLEYLNYFDTNAFDSFRWFDDDTVWIMYDDNYPGAEMPKQINGVPVVWLTHNEDNSLGVVTDGMLPSRRYIEFGYESHCDSHLYICVYDIHYDGEFEPFGAVHSFYRKEFLDSILNASKHKQIE